MFRCLSIATALLLICPPGAWADGGLRATPDNWRQAWSWDPLILFNLGLLGWLYVYGLGRLWRKAGVGRVVGRGQAAAFAGSLVVLFAALISPLDALSSELASAHMVQHMLLMTVAAPLFILGSPALVLAWGVSPQWWRWLETWPPISRLLWQPWFAWLLYALALWAWHMPLLYQAALRDPLVHDAEHLSFFLAACLYWRLLIDPLSRRRIHPIAAVPYLFTTSLHAALLGVFMALSPQPWYVDYLMSTPAWGVSALEDQQLAGLIMWVPACLIYPAAAATLFGGWLSKLSSPAESRRSLEPCLVAEGGRTRCKQV